MFLGRERERDGGKGMSDWTTHIFFDEGDELERRKCESWLALYFNQMFFPNLIVKENIKLFRMSDFILC